MGWRFALLTLALLIGLVGVAQAQAPADIYYNDFEFPDMRFIPAVPTGDTVILPGEMPNQPTGICRFGSGVCTGFYGHAGGSSSYLQFVNDPANCHSGNWCMRANLPAGVELGTAANIESGYSTGNIAQGCSTNSGPFSNCATRRWFFRWFMKWATNFRIITAPGRLTCQGKIFYARDFSYTGPNGTPPFDALTYVIVFRPAVQTAPGSDALLLTHGGTTLAPEFPNGQPELFLPTIHADGFWHEFEVEIDTSSVAVPTPSVWNDPSRNNALRVWIDGQPVFEKTDFQVAHPFTPDNNHWGMYINNNPKPNPAEADVCSVVSNTSFWIDDLAVSTQRIGGSGSPPPPPNAPTNLHLTQWLYKLWAWLVTGPRYA